MTAQIIQLTDCHLFADPAADLRGIVTWPRFVRVLEAIRERFPDIDQLVLTGDVTHDEQEATYRAVRDILGPMMDRTRMLPGNHDDREVMRSVFPELPGNGNERLTFSVRVGAWQLIGLDSQLTGEVSGRLGDQQLDWLRGELAEHGDAPTVIFVHHPPVSVRSVWLDEIGLADAAELLAAVESSPHVRLVCCGHVHQDSTTATAGRAIVQTTPAVGPPFRPRTEEIIIDDVPPSARLLELAPDGGWATRVLRFPK